MTNKDRVLAALTASDGTADLFELSCATMLDLDVIAPILDSLERDGVVARVGLAYRPRGEFEPMSVDRVIRAHAARKGK